MLPRSHRERPGCDVEDGLTGDGWMKLLQYSSQPNWVNAWSARFPTRIALSLRFQLVPRGFALVKSCACQIRENCPFQLFRQFWILVRL